jgi:hypothetical protein
VRRREAAVLTALLVCGLTGATGAVVDVFKDYDRMTPGDDYYRRFDRNYNGYPDDCERGTGRRFSKTSPWNRPHWRVIPTAGDGVQTSTCMWPRVLPDTSVGVNIDVVHSPGDTSAPALSLFDSNRLPIEIRTTGGRYDRLTRMVVAPTIPWPIGKAYVLIVTGQDSLWGEVQVRVTKFRPH